MNTEAGNNYGQSIEERLSKSLEDILIDVVGPVLMCGESKFTVIQAVNSALNQMIDLLSVLISELDEDGSDAETAFEKYFNNAVRIKNLEGLVQIVRDFDLSESEQESTVNEFFETYEEALNEMIELLETMGFNQMLAYGVYSLDKVVHTRDEIQKVIRLNGSENDESEFFPNKMSHDRFMEGNTEIKLPVLFMACVLISYRSTFSNDNEEQDEHINEMIFEIENMFLDLIRAVLGEKAWLEAKKTIDSLKIKQSKTNIGPLDLNAELILMELFEQNGGSLKSEKVVREISAAIKSTEKLRTTSEYDEADLSEEIMHLDKHGMYREIVEQWDAMRGRDLTLEAGRAVIRAKLKLAAMIDFDEIGMPFSNDPSPQYPWADLNSYRLKLSPPLNDVCNADDEKFHNEATARFKPLLYHFHNRACVEQQLQTMKRSSVAELLRKLVNKDLNWGESQSVSDTRAGLLKAPLSNPYRTKPDTEADQFTPYFPDVCRTMDPDNMPEATQAYLPAIFQEFDSDFRSTCMKIETLFDPFNKMLEAEMHRFGRILKAKFGELYIVMPPRVKTVESTLLKLLKESRLSVGEVTDLIGFTVLTDTDEQTEQVYYEIEAMMDPEKEIKPHDMWLKESSRGRRSMDITGVPKGSNVRLQVQCRPERNERLWRGRLANHDAYKAITGGKLLHSINADPDKYLDALYRAVHNLNMAYHAWADERTTDPGRILELYTADYPDGLSIIRAESLY